MPVRGCRGRSSLEWVHVRDVMAHGDVMIDRVSHGTECGRVILDMGCPAWPASKVCDGAGRMPST